ncbi:hypothetical protein LTR10_023840 [Elasticomyces elasticus]|nr:hypothetical protein LTR10_023840 [Elasticomyces elasticus]
MSTDNQDATDDGVGEPSSKRPRILSKAYVPITPALQYRFAWEMSTDLGHQEAHAYTERKANLACGRGTARPSSNV